MEIYNPDSHGTDPARRLVCPARPEAPDDKEVVEHFARILANSEQDLRAVVEKRL
jgi:hypothetical protein